MAHTKQDNPVRNPVLQDHNAICCDHYFWVKNQNSTCPVEFQFLKGFFLCFFGFFDTCKVKFTAEKTTRYFQLGACKYQLDVCKIIFSTAHACFTLYLIYSEESKRGWALGETHSTITPASLHLHTQKSISKKNHYLHLS